MLRAYRTVAMSLHFWMLVSSTPWLTHTKTSLYLLAVISMNEREKNQNHIIHVEHGCFSSLVLITAAGPTPITTIIYKRIASLLSQKFNQTYQHSISWIRCKLGFALIRYDRLLFLGHMLLL